ncbi:hypothetical protein MRX96_052333, partial [Rhipicephalus microplus]
EDMDSFLAKYIFIGLAVALVTLTIAPYSAEAIPMGAVDAAAKAMENVFGREGNAEE